MKIKLIGILILSGLLLTGCGKKETTSKITPTPLPRSLELSREEMPYVSLVPRDDGHLLTLKVSNIPQKISFVEYELIYKAEDEGMEIEKGVGDTVKDIKGAFEKGLLLGTESCTNGCKYKYDNGVTGGMVNLTLYTKDNQVTTAELPFSLVGPADLKKLGKLSLNDFSVKVSNASGYWVVIKNWSNNYSIFGSSGVGKISDILPSTIQKSDKTKISGDYQISE